VTSLAGGTLTRMMIRPDVLTAIRAGEADLAFRRWNRPRVRVGTRLRTSVGVLEVTSVEQVALSRLTADEARRSGVGSLRELRQLLSAKADQPVWRVGLRYAGRDPREELREAIPSPEEITTIRARLDRLDRASSIGPWTRATLAIIDRRPTVRAPELAEELGRDTPSFKRDVRKLKELGLTESLDIGYRLSPRGAAVMDAETGQARERDSLDGTPLPRIGAPATRALRARDVWTLEQVRALSEAELSSMHGVGPRAVTLLREALAERGWEWGSGDG
jgi:hypothetical protein